MEQAWVLLFTSNKAIFIFGFSKEKDYNPKVGSSILLPATKPPERVAFFIVRPAGRFYLVMKVHYGPVKGNH
jgi:hypothetical protein